MSYTGEIKQESEKIRVATQRMINDFVKKYGECVFNIYTTHTSYQGDSTEFKPISEQNIVGVEVKIEG